MTQVRLVKHEAVSKCGSFEVRFADRTPSKFFHWDDVAGGCPRPEQVDRKQALEEAKHHWKSRRLLPVRSWPT
jgi:hypothetical protein